MRVIIARFDFDGQCLGYTNTLVEASTEWAKVDSTTHTNFLVDIDSEVDRVLVRLKAIEGDTLVVAYPEFILICEAGVDVPVEDLSVDLSPFVKPNPIRRGMPLHIQAHGPVDIYDVVGRRLSRYAPNRSQGYITIDTSPLAGGMYFIDVAGGRKGTVKVIVY
jgi:hypothetical protein